MRDATTTDEYPNGLSLAEAHAAAQEKYNQLQPDEKRAFDEMATHLVELRIQHKEAFITRTYQLAQRNIEDELESMTEFLKSQNMSEADINTLVANLDAYRKTKSKESKKKEKKAPEGGKPVKEPEAVSGSKQSQSL